MPPDVKYPIYEHKKMDPCYPHDLDFGRSGSLKEKPVRDDDYGGSIKLEKDYGWGYESPIKRDPAPEDLNDRYESIEKQGRAMGRKIAREKYGNDFHGIDIAGGPPSQPFPRGILILFGVLGAVASVIEIAKALN